MLVRKKNPEWFPSENKELKVGETIEITDPKQLILNGEAEAVGENGEVLSAFELYGVLVQDEMAEFQEYMKMKKAEEEKARLEKERVALEAQLAATKVETPTPAEAPAPVETAPVTEAPVVETVVETPAPVAEEPAKAGKKK